MKTDSFFYRFFSKFIRAFFILLGEEENKAARYKFISVEVKEQAFRFDGIFQPETSADYLYFVEAQFQHEDDFYLRFFGEIAVYLKQKNPVNPWRGVVLFPSEAFDPGVHPHYQEFFESGRLRRVYLDNLPEALLQRFPLNLLRIILDSKQKVLAIATDLVGQLPQQNVNEEERETFIALLVNLLLSKLPHMSRKEIEQMLEPLLSDIKKSRFYQEVAEELRPEIAQELRPEIAQELRPEIAQELRPEIAQESKQERNREIAKAMLKKNFDVELISEITGLSFEEIIALEKD